VNNGSELGEAVILYFLLKHLGVRNVCSMWPSTSNNIALLRNFTNVMKGVTGQVFHKVLIWNGGDLTPVIVGSKDNGCDATILGGSEATYISAMQTAENQGLTTGSITWFGLGTGYTQHVAQTVGHVTGFWANSEFLPWSLDSGNAALTQFKQLQQQHGFLLDGTAEAGYTAARLFVAALKSIDGPITRQSVGQALRSMKDVSTGGLTGAPFTWGKFNISSQFLQLKDGQWVPYGGPDGKWYTLPATAAQVESIVTGGK
jgi:branched-chain amino acid transport system substrate-binding protein